MTRAIAVVAIAILVAGCLAGDRDKTPAGSSPTVTSSGGPVTPADEPVNTEHVLDAFEAAIEQRLAQGS